MSQPPVTGLQFTRADRPSINAQIKVRQELKRTIEQVLSDNSKPKLKHIKYSRAVGRGES